MQSDSRSPQPRDKPEQQKSIKKSKYLQPAVFQAKLQANAKKNVIQDGPSQKYSQSPKPVPKADQQKTIRQQLGVNPFYQDQDLGQSTELGQISQSFSNQTLGASDRKHNFSGFDAYPAKSPETNDRQLFNVTENMSPITDISPTKTDGHPVATQNDTGKKKQPQSRNFKNQGGYIDSVHDLCIHDTNEYGRPRTSLQDLRNISARKYQVGMRDNSRNQKDKLKSAKKRPVSSLNEVNVDNVKNKSGTSLTQQNQASPSPNMVSAFPKVDQYQTMPSQQYAYQMQAPFIAPGGSTTTQYGGVNLVLPIQQFAQQQPYGNPSPLNNAGQGIPSNEFLSLKEISEHLGQKIDLIQNQISRISTGQRQSITQDDQNTPFRPSDQESDLRQSRTQDQRKPLNERESQTAQDDAQKLHVDELQDQKFQIYKLKEQIKLLEERLARDHDLHKDKSQTLETHIKMLQEDNQRLGESIKQRKQQVQGAISAQIKVKDSLIEELTSKLKESTKVIQHIKTQNKKLKEEVQQVQQKANQTFESQLADARAQIEEQLSKQLNSTISEQLSKQFEERLIEAKVKQGGDGAKYKQQLADKDREILLLSEKHEAALKAAEDAIQEAKKAVESRKTNAADLQSQIRDALATEFNARLAKAQAQIKEKDDVIQQMSQNRQRNEDGELAKAHEERFKAIKELQTFQQKQIDQDALNQAELTQNQKQISLQDTTIKQLTSQIDTLNSEKHQTSLKLDSLSAETQSLKQQYARQLEGLKSNQSESEKFILSQLQEAQTKVTDLEQQLNRAKENSSILEGQLAKTIDQKSSDNGMVQQITQQFQIKLQQLDADLAHSRKSQKDAETQAFEMLKLKEDLQVTVTDLDAQLKQSQTTLQEQEQQLRADMDKIKVQGQTDKNEIEKLKESKKDLSLKLAKLQKENLMKTKEDEKSKKAVQDELDKALELIKERTTENEELEKEHIEQLNYINQIKRSEDALKIANESQAQQLMELQQQIKQLKAAQKSAEDEMTETFMAELNSVQSQLDAKSDESTRLAQESYKKSQELQILNDKIKSLQMALNEAMSMKQGEVDSIERKNMEQLNEIVKLKSEISQVNQLAAGHLTQIEDLQTKLDSLNKREAVDSENRKQANLQMQQALESALIKQSESAQQAAQSKAEIEKVRADSQKAQDAMQAIFQTQIKEIQGMLVEKQTEVQGLISIKGQFDAQTLTVQSQASEIQELRKQVEAYKLRENQSSQQQREQDSQVQLALQASSQKAADSASQVQLLSKQIEQLKAAQKSAEDEMTETFMAELNSVQKQLDAKSDEANSLIKEAQRMQQEAKNVQMQLDALKKALSEATRAKTEAEELTEITIEKLRADYEFKTAQLQQELDKALELKRDSSTKRMEAQNEKAQELGKLKNSMEKQQDDTEQVIMKFTTEMATKDKQIMEAKTNYNKLIQQIAKLEEQSASEREHLQRELKKQQQQIKQLEQETIRANDLESELKSLQSQLELKENELQQVKFKLSQTQSNVNDLSSLDSGVSKSPATKQPPSQKTSVVDETQTAKNLKFEIDTLTSQVQDQTQEIEQLQDTNEELKRELDELKARKPTKDQASFEDEIKKNVQQLMVKEAELDSLRKQVKQLKDTISTNDNATMLQELSRKVAMAEQEKSMNRMIIEQLNQELTSKDAELTKKANQEKQLTETVQKLSMQIATLSMQAMTAGKK